MRMFRKFVEVYRLARYGPTRLARIEERLAQLPALAAKLEANHAEVQARIDAVLHEARLNLAKTRAEHENALEEHREQLRVVAEGWRRDLELLRSQVSALATAYDQHAARSATPGVPPSAAAFEQGFYPHLEAAFRGSAEDVKMRLSVYRDTVAAMPAGRVADLGCGRGEWLELLGTWGRDATGVDANAHMVAEARAKGVAVEQGDALSWLQSQAGGAFAGVSVFHVVEHMPFGLVLRLMMESHRVLAPGGTLIVETPNPENVAVATQTFWLDPTHLRPLPADLLELAARYCGFAKVDIRRLNPPESGDAPGRDLALIATKAVAQ